MGKNLRRVGGYLIGLSCLMGIGDGAIASSAPQSCPRDTQILTEWLVQDLPSYANRILHRSKLTSLSPWVQTYVIIAGRAEDQPLPLRRSPSQYRANFPEATPQIFFTTLERQYSNKKLVRFQNFNWLFLAPTEKGWRLVMSVSQLASLIPEPPNDPPLPPIDTTDGVVGRAVQLWLRDCEAGTLRRKD